MHSPSSPGEAATPGASAPAFVDAWGRRRSAPPASLCAMRVCCPSALTLSSPSAGWEEDCFDDQVHHGAPGRRASLRAGCVSGVCPASQGERVSLASRPLPAGARWCWLAPVGLRSSPTPAQRPSKDACPGSPAQGQAHPSDRAHSMASSLVSAVPLLRCSAKAGSPSAA